MYFQEDNGTKRKLSGAIFDLDGTLLDSMPFWGSVGAQFLQRYDIPITMEIAQKVKTMTLYESAEYFCGELGVPRTILEIMQEIISMINEQYRLYAPLKEGAREVLEKLKQAGIPMCIATATDEKLVHMALRRLGLDEGYFIEVATCMGWNTSKHKPYIFEECARRMGTDPAETVVFEDSLHSIRTAAAAGFPIVAIYDESAAAEQEEIRSLACCCLKQWKDLITE